MIYEAVFFVLTTSVLLAGCSSAVRLDDEPVGDRVGSAIPLQRTEGSSSAVVIGGVASIDIAHQVCGTVRIVYFDNGRIAIKPALQSLIYLKGDKSPKAAMQGYTDERGSREYNLALGKNGLRKYAAP